MNAPALLATYQLRQREYLLRITRALTSRLDLPSVLRLILASAAELVGCRTGLIVLAHSDVDAASVGGRSTRFQIRASVGIQPNHLSAFEPLLEIPPMLQEDGSPDRDAHFEPYFVDLQIRVRVVEEKLGFALGQVVGLPLLVEDNLLGVIYLFRGEYAFTQLDWQFLQGFADQAAIAVRNASLYQQLETERIRLAAIVENSVDGIAILDAQRRTLVINQALATLVGVAPEDAVGMPCGDLLPLQNVAGVDPCDNTVDYAPEEKARSEAEIVRPGSKRLTVTITATPLFNERGELENIVVNVHDVTRQHEEEEIKSTFTSIISHELKTPVALIKGYAQTLARPDARWDPETARQGLEIIEEEADRLEALINNLLDVSRIQAGGLRLDFSDVNLNLLIGRVAEAFRTQSESHTIEVDLPVPLPLVWADEERLRQVLTNLLANAIKYSPSGGLIRIGGWSDRTNGPGRVVVYVADQGIGIPPDELAHIFERYYRVDSGLRRQTAGMGLGLFLSKAIVDAHGGEIWARSEKDRGTTFFVGLPIEPNGEVASNGGEISLASVQR